MSDKQKQGETLNKVPSVTDALSRHFVRLEDDPSFNSSINNNVNTVPTVSSEASQCARTSYWDLIDVVSGNFYNVDERFE